MEEFTKEIGRTTNNTEQVSTATKKETFPLENGLMAILKNRYKSKNISNIQSRSKNLDLIYYFYFI